jgi:hypothetical protein
MTALVEDDAGQYVPVELEPHCGADFCDQCGDCLHCHGSEHCPETSDSKHTWVVYKHQRDEFFERHKTTWGEVREQ